MDIAIFGTGLFYKNRRNEFTGYKIVAFLDNDKEKQGTELENIGIISPKEWEGIRFDKVVLMSAKAAEMREQLLNEGIDEENILDFNEFLYMRDRHRIDVYYGDSFGKQRKVLIISNPLDYTGAPIACLYAAMAIRDIGYAVTIAAEAGNRTFIDEITAQGINVYLYRYICSGDESDVAWVKEFDHVIVNTFSMLSVVDSIKNFCKPIIWIHEAEQFYDRLDLDIDAVRLNAGRVFAVSTWAQKNLKRYFPSIQSDILQYAIIDEADKVQSSGMNKQKIVVGLIGSACKRKGQLEFLNSLKQMPKEYIDQIRIIIVGDIPNDEYGKNLLDEIDKLDFCTTIGTKTRQEMPDVFKMLDVIAVPSTDDPLPIVATEGMMHGKICMASDHTGTASFIKDKENGIVLKSGDSENMRKQLMWLIDHREKMETMAEKSRHIFDEYFSMESFKKKLRNVLEE